MKVDYPARLMVKAPGETKYTLKKAFQLHAQSRQLCFSRFWTHLPLCFQVCVWYPLIFSSMLPNDALYYKVLTKNGTKHQGLTTNNLSDLTKLESLVGYETDRHVVTDI